MTDWVKSRFCKDNGCLEVRLQQGVFQVRNSERPTEVVSFTHEEWQAFTDGIRSGDFRLD